MTLVPHPDSHTMLANITWCENAFIAQLGDGAQLASPSLSGLAKDLEAHGLTADDLLFDWRKGHRILTAGQRVELGTAISQRHRRQMALSPH